MRIASWFVVMCLAAPADAFSQESSRRRDPRVFVTLADGETVVTGALLSLGHESVALLVGSTEWRYPLAAVRRVERHGDGSFDGAFRGAVFVGGLCVFTCAQGARDGAHLAQIAATNAVIGAVIGWWADKRRVGRTTLYPIPARRP